MSKFGSRDVKVWRLGTRIIDRTFLRNTLRLIQLSVLHLISTEINDIKKFCDDKRF